MDISSDEIADAIREFIQLDGEEEIIDDPSLLVNTESRQDDEKWSFGKHADRNSELSRGAKTIADYWRRWKRYEEFVSKNFAEDVIKSQLNINDFCLERLPETPSYIIAWICYECDLETEINPDTNTLMGCLGKSVTIFFPIDEEWGGEKTWSRVKQKKKVKKGGEERETREKSQLSLSSEGHSPLDKH